MRNAARGLRNAIQIEISVALKKRYHSGYEKLRLSCVRVRVRGDQIFYDQYTIRVLKDPRNKKKEKKEKEIILYYIILN